MNEKTNHANWRILVEKKPGIHPWPPGQLSFLAIADEVLEYIAAHTNEKTCSLETGLGASTIVFAATKSRHVCITPATDEIERITNFFFENGVSTDRISFEPDYSEFALPRLTMPALDFVLIDGRHGFPAPMIDWYYTSRHLKVGGILLVDDVHLWPVRMLVDYLSSSSSWKEDRTFDRTISYRRIAEGDERADWIHQSNVETKTNALQGRLRREQQMKKIRELARSGRFDLLIRKTIRSLFRQR